MGEPPVKILSKYYEFSSFMTVLSLDYVIPGLYQIICFGSVGCPYMEGTFQTS